MAAQPELLVREPSRAWRPAAIVAAAAVVVAALAVAWYADHRATAREHAALTRCSAALAGASREYDVRMSAMFDYADPGLAGAPRAHARLLATLMAQPARQVLPAARSASAGCRDVRVLPWHTSLAARRSAGVAYGDALVARLERVAAARTAFRLDDSRLAALRRAAGVPPALGLS